MYECPVKVSIIIPVYNVEQYITDCIESVISQTRTTGVECIIVDDCGRDGSITIASRIISGYTGNIKFSIVSHGKNMGLSCARNTGIQAASGEYVFFLDGDDKMSEDAVDRLLTPADTVEYDVITGDYCVEGGCDVFMHLSLPEGAYYGRDAIAGAKRKNLWYPMVWGKLYRRKFLLDNQLLFCGGILHEDELFSVEIACVINSMYCIPSAKIYLYRVRDNSIMTSNEYAKRLDSCRRMLLEMYIFLEQMRLQRVPVCNDLLYYLFSYANETSWKYSKQDYYKYYPIFRRAVSGRYGERLLADKRIRAIVRDIHFLLPSFLGARLFCFQTFKK